MKKIILTDEQTKEIVRLYEEELLGSPAISEKMNICKHIVLKTLKENGIKLGPSGRRFTGGKSESDKRHYRKNREKRLEYFSTWQKENKDHRKNIWMNTEKRILIKSERLNVTMKEPVKRMTPSIN